MTRPLILDTGAWLHALEGADPWISTCDEASDLIVPALVLAELDHFLRRQRRAMHKVLRDIDQGHYQYEPCTPGDLTRARELDEKFKQMELGLVDASIVALAERLGIHRVLTVDSDLAAVRIGHRYDRALELACPLPRSSQR